MKTHILVGSLAVKFFEEEEWEYLERSVLQTQSGDIIAWNKETDSVSELIESLKGWEDFIELSGEDLKEITLNTNIVIV